MEEIGCKCQTVLISLSQVAGGNKVLVLLFFPPSLYKFKRRFLLKFYVAVTEHLVLPEFNFSQTLS